MQVFLKGIKIAAQPRSKFQPGCGASQFLESKSSSLAVRLQLLLILKLLLFLDLQNFVLSWLEKESHL
jgi:hypothetical protein